MSTTLYFVGYAQPPTHSATKAMFGTLSLGLVVDEKTSKVVEVGCTAVSSVTESFVREILINYDLSAGPDLGVQLIEKRYHGKAQRALVVAFKDAWRIYKDFIGK